MSRKQRQADRASPAAAKVTDSFNNFMAQIGIGTNNVSAGSTYTFTYLTKNRILLEALYRGSWVIGAAVDMLADDMTQAGIDIQSDMKPGDIEKLNESIQDLQVWSSINSCTKWSRLYGSAVGVYLIDGQDMSTPLRIETVGKGQFKGILPMDRWQLIPSIGDLIREYGPDMSKPRYYQTISDYLVPNLGNIHHTRLFRMDSIELPHFQKLTENLWGESIIERIYDRLLAFDSTTQGAAQLVFKAYLRTWSVENLREIMTAGGPAMNNLVKNVQQIRQFQSNEGLTLMDAKDKFEAHSYTFAGLDQVLLQFGQQLSGALEIPMVRLFGQSPAGLNSTGESDLRTYYDGIKRKQETKLRRPLKNIIELAYRSTFGDQLPDGFAFQFKSLWQTSDNEKADMGQKDTSAIQGAFDSGIITRATALKELRQASARNGLFSNVTDEDIADAEDEPPLSELANQEILPDGKADPEKKEEQPVP